MAPSPVPFSAFSHGRFGRSADAQERLRSFWIKREECGERVRAETNSRLALLPPSCLLAADPFFSQSCCQHLLAAPQRHLSSAVKRREELGVQSC